MFSVRINGKEASGWRRWTLIAVSIAFGVPFVVTLGFLVFDAWMDLLALLALGAAFIGTLHLLFENVSVGNTEERP